MTIYLYKYLDVYIYLFIYLSGLIKCSISFVCQPPRLKYTVKHAFQAFVVRVRNNMRFIQNMRKYAKRNDRNLLHRDVIRGRSEQKQ